MAHPGQPIPIQRKVEGMKRKIPTSSKRPADSSRLSSTNGRVDEEKHEPRSPRSAVHERLQMPLWVDDPSAENSDYLSRQLITYIGNKRALLGPIVRAVEQVKRRLGKNRLRVVDAFSGSGVVSR